MQSQAGRQAGTLMTAGGQSFLTWAARRAVQACATICRRRELCGGREQDTGCAPLIWDHFQQGQCLPLNKLSVLEPTDASACLAPAGHPIENISAALRSVPADLHTAGCTVCGGVRALTRGRRIEVPALDLGAVQDGKACNTNSAFSCLRGPFGIERVGRKGLQGGSPPTAIGLPSTVPIMEFFLIIGHFTPTNPPPAGGGTNSKH